MFLRWWGGVVVANTQALYAFDRSNNTRKATQRNHLHMGILTSQVRFRASGMMYINSRFGCLSMSVLSTVSGERI